MVLGGNESEVSQLICENQNNQFQIRMCYVWKQVYFWRNI